MLITMLQKMLTKSGFLVSSKTLGQFLMFIKDVSPWFMEEGTMTLDEWKRVGKEMRQYVQKNRKKTLPPQAYSLWLQLREILSEETPLKGKRPLSLTPLHMMRSVQKMGLRRRESLLNHLLLQIMQQLVLRG